MEERRKNEANWRARNREVANARSADWRKNNPDRQRRAEENYRRLNPEKRKASCASWRQANIEHERDRARKWRAENRDLLSHVSALRRAAKLRATPPWANQQAIKAIYKEAAKLTQETGVQWDVDHIFPLKHELFCGLHCEANLRIMLASANRAKGNRVPPEALEPIILT